MKRLKSVGRRQRLVQVRHPKAYVVNALSPFQRVVDRLVTLYELETGGTSIE